MGAKHEPRMTGTKFCPRCETDKPVLHFSVDRKNVDGLYYVCRNCANQADEQTPSRQARKTEMLDKRLAKLRADYNWMRG
jgi:protein-arginine kinase activator protein McsA